MQGYQMAPAGYGQPIYGAPFYAQPGYGSPVYMPPVYVPPPQFQAMPVGPYYNPAKEAQMNGRWSDGIFGCCSHISTLCMAMFCDCCLVYRVMRRLQPRFRYLVISGDPAGAAFLYCCCALMPFVRCCIVRGVSNAVSAQYRITDEAGYCQACFCPCCTLTQASRHIDRAQGYLKD